MVFPIRGGGYLPKEGFKTITVPEFLLRKLKFRARNYRSIAEFLDKKIV